MKITSFEPMIVSKDAESAIKLFEELGFERRHKKEGINGKDITSVSMKDANGFHVTVASSTVVPQDITSIRMNVRDFDEAFEFLTARGFKNAQGDKVTETSTSKSALMISPSGFAINLTEHIRK